MDEGETYGVVVIREVVDFGSNYLLLPNAF